MSGSENPFDKFLTEESNRLGIPKQLVSVLAHCQDTVATFDMHKSIKEPCKRHAYRLLLNCVDVLADLATDKVVEEVENANRKICMTQLQTKELSEKQRSRLEISAFYE